MSPIGDVVIINFFLNQVYALNGSVYNQSEVVGMYADAVDKFKAQHDDFIGSKFIFAPVRHVSLEVLDSYIETLMELRAKFGNFVAGFDLVGQEDKGYPLKDFAHRLLEVPDDINFFFHAGETNWNGLTDENLVNTLIQTIRIGTKCHIKCQ